MLGAEGVGLSERSRSICRCHRVAASCASERTTEGAPHGDGNERRHGHEHPHGPAARHGPDSGQVNEERCPAESPMHGQSLTQLAPEEANQRRAFVLGAPSSETSHKHDGADHQERWRDVSQDQHGCPERRLEDHAASVVRAYRKQADDDPAASAPKRHPTHAPPTLASASIEAPNTRPNAQNRANMARFSEDWPTSTAITGQHPVVAAVGFEPNDLRDMSPASFQTAPRRTIKVEAAAPGSTRKRQTATLKCLRSSPWLDPAQRAVAAAHTRRRALCRRPASLRGAPVTVPW